MWPMTNASAKTEPAAPTLIPWIATPKFLFFSAAKAPTEPA